MLLYKIETMSVLVMFVLYQDSPSQVTEFLALIQCSAFDLLYYYRPWLLLNAWYSLRYHIIHDSALSLYQQVEYYTTAKEDPMGSLVSFEVLY